MVALSHTLITTNESEKLALQRMDGMLNGNGRGDISNSGSLPKLVGPHGEEIELPLSVFQLLKMAVHYMMLGRAFSIIPMNKELSTQEAADILNVSRPFLVNLLETGKIPFVKIGT